MDRQPSFRQVLFITRIVELTQCVFTPGIFAALILLKVIPPGDLNPQLRNLLLSSFLLVAMGSLGVAAYLARLGLKHLKDKGQLPDLQRFRILAAALAEVPAILAFLLHFLAGRSLPESAIYLFLILPLCHLFWIPATHEWETAFQEGRLRGSR